MPLNNSLISGAQSLFGVKTELKFGKTRIKAIFSEQKSESRSVTSQGGGTVQEFEFRALNYDENRNFFLSHYFRNKYDEALLNYPFINSNIQFEIISLLLPFIFIILFYIFILIKTKFDLRLL